MPSISKTIVLLSFLIPTLLAAPLPVAAPETHAASVIRSFHLPFSLFQGTKEKREPSPGFIIGAPCFGPGCSGLTRGSKDKREAAPEAKSETTSIFGGLRLPFGLGRRSSEEKRKPGFIIGAPCFGPRCSGLTRGSKEKRDPGFIIGTPCLGPGCSGLTRGSKAKREPGFIIGAPCFGPRCSGLTRGSKREAEANAAVEARQEDASSA